MKIASRFSRIGYLMVAGRQLLDHPCMQPRGYILDKLIVFHQEHGSPPTRMMADLQAATAQLPAKERPLEAIPLAKRLQETRVARRRGPQPIGDILPLLLAKLGAGQLQSVSGVRDLG